jgi:hypothetical protein
MREPAAAGRVYITRSGHTAIISNPAEFGGCGNVPSASRTTARSKARIRYWRTANQDRLGQRPRCSAWPERNPGPHRRVRRHPPLECPPLSRRLGSHPRYDRSRQAIKLGIPRPPLYGRGDRRGDSSSLMLKPVICELGFWVGTAYEHEDQDEPVAPTLGRPIMGFFMARAPRNVTGKSGRVPPVSRFGCTGMRT